MIVAALVIAALLVDRFLLLPGFEAGKGSGGAAWALWLGINLAPAAAWLLLHRGDETLTGGQRVQGTLAVVVVTTLGILPVLIWYGSTGGALS